MLREYVRSEGQADFRSLAVNSKSSICRTCAQLRHPHILAAQSPQVGKA
jgi:hypothetical protein